MHLVDVTIVDSKGTGGFSDVNEYSQEYVEYQPVFDMFYRRSPENGMPFRATSMENAMDQLRKYIAFLEQNRPSVYKRAVRLFGMNLEEVSVISPGDPDYTYLERTYLMFSNAEIRRLRPQLSEPASLETLKPAQQEALKEYLEQLNAQ